MAGDIEVNLLGTIWIVSALFSLAQSYTETNYVPEFSAIMITIFWLGIFFFIIIVIGKILDSI